MNECTNEKYYLRDINFWTVFKMNAMSDYHGFYLKTESLLLVDVFESLFIHASNITD